MREDRLFSVIDGICYPLEGVQDEMFSRMMLGDGVAVRPSESIVRAPCDGTVMVLPKSKHAFGIRCENGQEILVHIGIDTVMLDGNGFESYVEVNDKVKTGQKIISFDPELLTEEKYDMSVMILLLNGTYQIRHLTKKMNQEIHAGEEIIRYRYVKDR